MNRKKLRDESEAFAKRYLGECATELIEWGETSLLREGKVRELAKLCSAWAGSQDALPIAERMVNRAALNAASTPNVEIDTLK